MDTQATYITLTETSMLTKTLIMSRIIALLQQTKSNDSKESSCINNSAIDDEDDIAWFNDIEIELFVNSANFINGDDATSL